MNNYSVALKHTLFSLIDDMAAQRIPFVKDPHKDFTRNRKLSLPTVFKSLLSLGGSSIAKEILESFSFSEDMPSAPALFKQRSIRRKGDGELCVKESTKIRKVLLILN